MPTEFLISALASELPFDGAALCVPVGLPSIDFPLQKMSIGDSTIQALTSEDADFDLCHVEPTRMLGRVVEAHATQQLAGVVPAHR